MDGTWDVRRKWVKNDHEIFGLTTEVLRFGKAGLLRKGGIKFNFRRVKIDVTVWHQREILNWQLDIGIVVQSRIWDWSYRCGVGSIWRNQESSAWKPSLSRRHVTWSPVSSITAGANKMSIDQRIWSHGDIGDLDTFHWVVGDESPWLKSVSEKIDSASLSGMWW